MSLKSPLLDTEFFVGQLFQGVGGYDPTNTSAIPNQGTPQTVRFNTGGIYSDAGGGNIFHTSSYAYNDKARATVAVFGQGKGNHVWGGNFVGYADTSTSANGVPTAIGIEVDFGLLGTGAAGSIAYGIVLASAGGSVGAPQNDGAFIQMQPNNSLSPVKNGLKITKSGTDQPITADGSAILINSITCAFGINFASSVFTTNAIQFGSGQNIGISSVTGTKIGSNSSLISLYGATPTARYATTGTSAGFTAGGGTTVTHTSTFTGGTGATAYTIGDIVLCLKSLGVMIA